MRKRSILIGATIAFAVAAHTDAGATDPAYREVPTLKLYARAKWRGLVPDVSTIADVRKQLGAPREEEDAANMGVAYAGDGKAARPILTYALGKDWDTVFYFARVGDKVVLLDIHLRPEKAVTVPDATFKKAGFVRRSAPPGDGLWDTWSNDSGVSYQIRVAKGGHARKRKTLDRVVYDAPQKRAP